MIGFGVRTDLAPSQVPPAPALDSAGERSVLLARVGAVGIDLACCYFLVEIPLFYLASELFSNEFEAFGVAAVGLSVLALVPLYLTYSFYFEWRYSRTPGKVNRGLVVAMADGRPCTLRASALRNLLRYVDFLGVPPLVLGLVGALASPAGRRLGDWVAGTVVVRTRAPEDDARSLPGLEDLPDDADGDHALDDGDRPDDDPDADGARRTDASPGAEPTDSEFRRTPSTDGP